MSQAIYRKWRPTRFDDVVGQEHVTRTLQRAITSGRIGHAYLFCGPRGTGKTTTARLLAKAVNCKHEDSAEHPCNECSICIAVNESRFLDLIEIDAASNTGVDDIRNLREKINFAPSEGRYKVYIIDEVHMLSTAAFNALLKTLEEPPPHAIFVLATTEEHKVLATIKSRCQQFNFRLLSTPEIISRLEWLSGKESLTVEPEAINLIAREGAGSLRDAESLLDQLVTAPGDTITLARTQQVLGTASSQSVIDLTGALLANDTPTGLKVIHDALTMGADARQFSRQMVAYLRQMMLLKTGGDKVVVEVSADHQKVIADQASSAPRSAIIAALKIFNDAALAPGNSWQPQLPLELAFLDAVSVADAPVVRSQKADDRPQQPPPAAPTPEPKPPTKPKPTPPPAKAVAEPKADPAPVAPPEPTVSEPAAAPAQGKAILLDTVQQQWRTAISTINQRDRNVAALFKMAVPLGVEGETIVMGFDYLILRDKFEGNPKAKVISAETLSSILGTKCQVRTVVTSEYTPPKGVNRAELEALADELGGVVRDD